MVFALALAGLAMGVASAPHCALMCGAPCAAVTGGRGPSALGFHLGRLAGYMAGGGLAAAGMATLGAWALGVPVLRQLWLLLHLAFLLLGLWWLATGAMPARLLRDGGTAIRFVRGRAGPRRASIAGLAWVAWPCGTLQGALLLAALANDAVGGAVVMAGFALGSSPGLLAAPWLWRRLRGVAGTRLDARAIGAMGYRVGGFALVLSSGWAVAHALGDQLKALCAA